VICDPVLSENAFHSLVVRQQHSDSLTVKFYIVVQKKLHKVYCTVILQLFAAESCGFHQSAQKLTGNAKNGQILNTVVTYSLFGSLLPKL